MSKILFKAQLIIVICAAIYSAHLFWINPPLSQAESNDVILLVTEGCSFCDKTEVLLNTKGVPYKRYDIRKDAQGKILYQKLGGGGVPLIKIGSTIIRGYQPIEIMLALKMQRS